jgi:hypothetical protein
MKCYQCVVQAPLGTIPDSEVNEAKFIINGHSVCGIQDHIDAVIANPGASGVTITRREKIDPERAARLKVTNP